MANGALSNKNPFFGNREIDWTLIRDAYGGERYIKEKGVDYLPATTAQMRAGMASGGKGLEAYNAYKMRAVYHDLVKPALQGMLGVLHRKDAAIELPAKLEKMRERGTFRGESLQWLLQKINEQQILAGRYGLFLDVANGADATTLPYICGYNAEAIINWDSTAPSDDKGLHSIKLVVLDEKTFERGRGLQWLEVQKYRVLAMPEAVSGEWALSGSDFMAAVVSGRESATTGDFITPALAGRTLDAIPFVFIGPRDLVPEPDAPVMLPLARLALAIYRTEADYRQALFMQGQDTLVIKGQQASASGDKQEVGAFGSISLPKDGDAKYIGAESQGIQYLENCIQNDEKKAAQLGAQLLSERGNEAESGEALGIRVASRTASLTTVARVGAAGLQQILRHAAQWLDADPEKVIVKPNLDFMDDPAQAQDLTYLMTGKSMGAPLSGKSIHGWLRKREFTQMEYEEEMAQLEEEGPSSLGGLAGGGAVRGVPGGPNPPGAPNAPVPGAAPRGSKGAAAAAAKG